MSNCSNRPALRVPVFAVVSILLFACTAMAQLSERDRGFALYLDQDYSNAVDVLNRVFENDKKDQAACVYLAASQHKLQNEKAALSTLRKCRRIKSGYTSPSTELFDKKLEITYRQIAHRTPAAERRGQFGEVLLLVEFLPDGTVGFTIPVRKLGYGLTEAAIEATHKFKFIPAKRNGRPISDIRLIRHSWNVY